MCDPSFGEAKGFGDVCNGPLDHWCTLPRLMFDASANTSRMRLRSHNTQRLEVLVEDLDTSLRHIMFGSFDPPIAAPPSQEKFDHMLTHLAPEVADLKQA